MSGPDDIVVQIAGKTTLTKRDCDDLLAAYAKSADALAELMQFYIDMGTVSDRGVWVEIGEKLKQAEPYLSIAGVIIGLATGGIGLIKAV